VVVVVAIALAMTRSHAAADEAAFQEQLRLARQEGIPTTAAEYAAHVPTATPAENAGPFYRQLKTILHKESGRKTDLTAVDQDVIFHPTAKSRAAAESVLANHHEAIVIVTKAVQLPKCWFDRKWSDGPGVPLPEYADMKEAAKLLAIRGSLAAGRGDSAAALADARRIFVIAGHAGSEPHAISRLIRDGAYHVGMRDVAYWAFMHPDQPAYREALKKALDEMPRPNLREEHLDHLYTILWLMENSTTPQGRAKIGLREEDMGAAEKVLPVLLSRSKARAQVVKAERDYWAALIAPQKDRRALIEQATSDLYKAMLAYPTAASVYEALSAGEDGTIEREPEWEARKLEYEAFLRALDGKGIARSIRTADLRSPFDGKPLSYRYDGKQVVMGVSGFESDSKPVLLKIPPDKAFGR
jgi:hypothetical protein